MGEIGIAGIGLAAGYLNRDDLTAEEVHPRLPRASPTTRPGASTAPATSAASTSSDEVEFHGRIDTQVKIRGYRIELTEIESVLLELPQIAQAAVITLRARARHGRARRPITRSSRARRSCRTARSSEALRSRLPAYMVPAYLEQLPIIPMTVSQQGRPQEAAGAQGPARSRSAAPSSWRRAARRRRSWRGALAEVLKVERVSVEDNFFKDLGAHSLLMARFCAEIRQHPGLSGVSMRDIYLNPTIAKLAAHLGAAARTRARSRRSSEPFRIPSNLEYYGCGALQLLFYAGYGAARRFGSSAPAFDLDLCGGRQPGASSICAAWRSRSACFVALTAHPDRRQMAADREVEGRGDPDLEPALLPLLGGQDAGRRARRWRRSPARPIYNLYLRLLGAKIGRNTVIQPRFVPVCTDLFSVGDNTILRKDSIAARLQGAVELHPHRLDHDRRQRLRRRGERARHRHRDGGRHPARPRVVAAERPARPRRQALSRLARAGDHGRLLPGRGAGTARRCGAGSIRRSRWSRGLAIFAPVAIMLLNYWYPYLRRSYTGGAELDSRRDRGAALAVAGRCWSRWSLLRRRAGDRPGGRRRRPAAVQPAAAAGQDLRAVRRSTTGSTASCPAPAIRAIYNLLFGDSSSIVHYLRWIGWNLNKVEQTGSNFGTDQKHDNPFLCEIGSGTMVSDGLSMINAHDVELVVQARQGEDRRPQLSRQQHPLSRPTARPARTACSAPR